MRIAGIDLQDSFKLDYALTHIRGIGWSLSKKILSDLKIPDKRVSELTPSEISSIASKIEEHPTEGDLARKVASDIQRLKVISSYRGIRHSRGLPVKGQRTKSNARTKRGKRKTVGAFKKEELAKKQVVAQTETESKTK
ncbi:30S ribosomal protein S13 [Candidatus Woesebacteria bacterium RIFCSPHIGHO2_02_FULL_38_9]|uniref:Small ribosomal subunit protein uS13 n=1 Tax=Candidatus Woesebacteria bacterium RIFCSPHIGHO2_01_FULL_39_28 TaxID=1802496 RepID=A0A1F7YA17_9BACT|nr:MAG: 30S ribosomal protein S13 [Candidatus Woesebacteria bacterium RIFCSPHIGHO2_01_FULL_39_28]OGM32230.1 MAG: 30S ribosomal protein S13 [Candidatus Woesebacteria bacterium RIFCSPHIGHO2_02_FULL_38_9]OGM58454.1 MAG: 30S ribosomal protein S13 [Candidatus Woesebacteria bacterium RIFCSPLOWO2_01_FULL_38_20]